MTNKMHLLIAMKPRVSKDYLQAGDHFGLDFLIGRQSISNSDVYSIENSHVLVIQNQAYKDIMREK